MNKEKKEEDKHNKVVGKLIKLLNSEYPGSPIDGIHIMREAMMIYFKALSLSHYHNDENVHSGTIVLVHNMHSELKRFIDFFHEDLAKMCEEEMKERVDFHDDLVKTCEEDQKERAQKK